MVDGSVLKEVEICVSRRCYCYQVSQHDTSAAVAAAVATSEVKGNVRYPYMCSLGYDVDDQSVLCNAMHEKES